MLEVPTTSTTEVKCSDKERIGDSPNTCRTSEGILTGSAPEPIEPCRKIPWNSLIAPISTAVRFIIAVATAWGKICPNHEPLALLSVPGGVGQLDTENVEMWCETFVEICAVNFSQFRRGSSTSQF